jgi:signal transduction histidine kinase/signal recognition particle receptor subunit beta
MVQFDNQFKQVKLKVVYYGPALGGKTTCLQHIHRVTDPQRRTKLYALSTAADRTLFFDLLALDLGRVRGYRLTLQLFTVPGQVQYNATRRAVLAGADAVVFVADSQSSQADANRESLANLSENLRVNGLDPDTIPLILLYNKRDLEGALPRGELDAALNRRSSQAFETVATTGAGVMEGFAAITEAAVRSVAERLGLAAQPEALARIVENVNAALEPFVSASGGPPPDAPVVIRPESPSGLLGSDELVGEAVRANIAMTDLNTRLDRLSADLERRVRQLRAIDEFGRAMSLAREPEAIATSALDGLLAVFGVNCGSLLLLDGQGQFQEVLRRGLVNDPVLQPAGEGGSAAALIVAARRAVSGRVDERGSDPIMASRWLDETNGLGFLAALAAPLVAQDRPMGLVTCYADARRGAFEEEDLEVASVLAGNAAVALANARAWRGLEQLNRSLEDTVAARTSEVEGALHKARNLAEQLEDRNVTLESANRQLREIETLKGDLLNRIAHEFNTPVTAIQTAARILARHEEVPPERIGKFAEIIMQEAGRLAELITSALQAVVLGVPEARPAPAPVAVADLLRRSVAPLKDEIGQRSLALTVKVASGLEQLAGDGEQLEAALRAIVKNAVEFNHAGGSVTVTVRPVRRGSRSLVELRVEDTGIGIPEAELSHVTELFWQGGNVLTGKPRGLGLGLAVARRVAENHGGTLEISSGEGRGTSVAMFLPAGS